MKTPAPTFSTDWRLKPLAAALVASAGLLAPVLGHAQSNQELLKELQSLKDRIQQLEDKLQQNAAKPAPAPAAAPAVSVEDFNRVSMKVEAAEDAQDASGMKGLKISGMMPSNVPVAETLSSSIAWMKAPASRPMTRKVR